MDSDVDMMSRYQPQPLDCGPDERCDVMFTSFLYCVTAPVGVMAVLLVLLIAVMCGSRRVCQCKKYSSLTSDPNDIQMESYNTIRRASASLRYMSHSGGAGMGSRAGSSATLDRSSYRRARRGREACHSAPGTLQRQHRNRHSSVLDDQTPAPPPPPPYSMHSDDLAYGSEFLPGVDMQTSVQSDCNPERNGNGAQPLLYMQHHHR